MSKSDDSDETLLLLQFAKTEPTDAFAKLMSNHLPAVKKSISRRLTDSVRSRVDPSDVAQDTQQKAYQQFDSYLARRPMPFRLWLLKTAHERIVEVERKHLVAQRRTVDREHALSLDSSLALLDRIAPSPVSNAVRNERAIAVQRCLAKLSRVSREILFLRFFDGLSNVEAATLLELNPETTKKRFSRALLQLRQYLTSAGFSSDEQGEA